MKRNRSKITMMLVMALFLTLLTALSYEPVKAAQKVSTPKIKVSAISEETGIKVTIKKTKNAQGYEIYLKGPQDEEFANVAKLEKNGKKKRKYSIKNLGGGEYSVKVKAYMLNGTQTVWSKESKVTKITIKGTSEEPKEQEGILTHKTDRTGVDVSSYVEENYPGLYTLYEDGKIDLKGEAKRDTIVLGSYELEYAVRENKGYKKTEKMPLEWEVLEYSADGTKALVISKYIICHRAFDDSSLLWEKSDLRRWLNSDFYNEAFTEDEQTAIRLSDIEHEDMFLKGNDTQDRIFLLSVNDVNEYFTSDYDRLGYYIDMVTDSWWVREDNRSEDYYDGWDSFDWDEEYEPDAHPTVSDCGRTDSDECDIDYDFIGVRPSFWIDLTEEMIETNNLSILTGTGAELEKAYVVFGNTGKDKQPIEWEILDYDEENERVMLISRYVVDKRNYNSSSEKNSWSASKLRKYLNGDFINESFSTEEQEIISEVSVENETLQGNKEKTTKDKVYILSYAEFLNYFPAPDYIVNQPDDDLSCYNWVNLDMKGEIERIWLRTYDEDEEEIKIVYSWGVIDEGMQATESGGVRPVLWLDLK